MDAAVRDIIVRSVLGGLLIALVLSLARMKLYVVSGLLVSVPAVSLYTFWWIGHERGAPAMRTAVHAALWSAIPWALYLLVSYLLAARLPIWLALISGVATYLLTNGIVWLLLQGRG